MDPRLRKIIDAAVDKADELSGGVFVSGPEGTERSRVPRHRPIPMQYEFEYGNIKWQRGESFNFRIWLALRILDGEAAKEYFRTTT